MGLILVKSETGIDCGILLGDNKEKLTPFKMYFILIVKISHVKSL